jgi:hypothetical protein
MATPVVTRTTSTPSIGSNDFTLPPSAGGRTIVA